MRDDKGPYGTIWDHTGPYCTVLSHTGPYKLVTIAFVMVGDGPCFGSVANVRHNKKLGVRLENIHPCQRLRVEAAVAGYLWLDQAGLLPRILLQNQLIYLGAENSLSTARTTSQGASYSGLSLITSTLLDPLSI